MTLMLNVFSIQNDWINEDIYLAGISSEVKELVAFLGGSTSAARAGNLSYSTIKEAKAGRCSIQLKKLNILLSLVSEKLKQSVQRKIEQKPAKFTVMRSNRNRQNLSFPKRLTPDLAYVIGLILGDGHLANDKENKNGNWKMTVCFDNHKHMNRYCEIIKANFGFTPKFYFVAKKNYYDCYFSSKVVQWFFRSFFKIRAGKKGHKITIPDRILNCDSVEVANACIMGLFDSDGTVTNRWAAFSSTSKVIVEQVFSLLQHQGICANKNTWIKAEKYLPLFTIRIQQKESLKRFSELIGFSHPAKRKRLNMLLN